MGRPHSRYLEKADPRQAEIYRLCTDGSKNACSFLMGAAWRLAKALGYDKLITYTLASENGASLKAANFRPVYYQKKAGGNWDSPSRRRTTKQKADKEPKVRWEITNRKEQK